MSTTKPYTSELASRIEEMINKGELSFEIKHLYLKQHEDNGEAIQHPMDVWHISVTVDGRTFRHEFRTGIGHRITDSGWKHEGNGFRSPYTGDFYTLPEAIKHSVLRVPFDNFSSTKGSSSDKQITVARNMIANFLHSCLQDANGATESFADWAITFGYNYDSLSALQTYLKCQEIRNQLYRAFGGKLAHELEVLEH